MRMRKIGKWLMISAVILFILLISYVFILTSFDFGYLLYLLWHILTFQTTLIIQLTMGLVYVLLIVGIVLWFLGKKK